MEMRERTNLRADYGIDAPKVVRNLYIVGSLGFLVVGRQRESIRKRLELAGPKLRKR